MKPALRDFLQLHLIILIFGFTAILGLLISLPTPVLVLWRTGLAAVGIGIFLKGRKEKGADRRAEGKKDFNSLFRSPFSFLPLLLTGSLVAAHWLLFFGSARVSTASVCLAGIATTSLWTSLLEPIFTRSRVRPLEVGLGGVVILGLYLIFRFEFDHALGLAMAVASAVLAALFSVLNGRFTQRHDPLVITAWEMTGAFLTTLLFLPAYATWLVPGEPLQVVPAGWDWLWLGLLAGVCTVYAYAASVRLMRKFSVFVINLTLNLEPVYGIVLAYLIFGERERMTTGFYAGTLVILAAVLAYPLLSRKSAQVRASSPGDGVVEKIG
jgi:drug/metabolite transporter (DMT)-like permease